MMKRYVLVEVTDDEKHAGANWPDLIRWDLVRAWTGDAVLTFRTTDVTDLVTYNRTTPGDPWDKPYPAQYAELMERIS